MALAPEISSFGDESHSSGEGGLAIDGGGFGALPGAAWMFQNPDRSGFADQLTIGAWNDIHVAGVGIPSSPNNAAGTVYLCVQREDLAWSQGFAFTLSTTGAAIDVRQRFDVVAFPFYAVDETDFYSFRPAVKDPAEDLLIELNLFAWCANYRRSNEQVAAGEHVRPFKPTGFTYRGTAGWTGQREPLWPRIVGATVQDGSVTWTCVDPGETGLSPLNNPDAASSPDGLTINAVSVSEATKIRARYQGGTLGQDFDAVFSFMLNGAPRVARQRVMVRKR